MAFKPLPAVGAYDREMAEQKFFDTPFLMSYSGLSKLLYSPALFYNHYVLNERDDTESKGAVEGNLLHLMLFRPNEFDNEFIISPKDLPSDNPKNIIRRCYEHRKLLHLAKVAVVSDKIENYNEHALEFMKDQNVYQSLKTDKQRLEKIHDLKGLTYWDYLVKSEGRTVVDDEMVENTKLAVSAMKARTDLMQLMGFHADMMNGIKYKCEETLVMLPGPYQFGLRGILDNLVFDTKRKIIRINDLKKFSKNIAEFPEAIEFWRYWLQAGIYHILVHELILSQEQYKDYEVEFRFIVVDQYLQMAPVRISPSTMLDWVGRAKAELEKANFHFQHKSFALPYAFLEHNELVI